MVEIHVTYSNIKEARKISRGLLQKHLVACANMYPVSSQYRWKGKIVDDKEILAVYKTVQQKVQQVQRFVERRHSYKVPCIVTLPVTRSAKKYSDWVIHETR